MAENRMYSNMLCAARSRLTGRNPHKLAKWANLSYSPQSACFQIPVLGKNCSLQWPSCSAEPECEEIVQLLMLHYLDLADGTPVQGKLISFGQLKDGMIRGDRFDRDSEERLRGLLSRMGEEELRRRCRNMGGCEYASNADFSAVLPFLPNYPVTLRVWFADEEFAASGRLFVDVSADHYLTVEDAVTVGELVLQRLEEVDHALI